MRKVAVLALAGACGLAVCDASKADQIVTFAAMPAAGVVPKTDDVGFRLEVTSTAVAAGSFSVATSPYGGGVPTGNVSEFVGLSWEPAGPLFSGWNDHPEYSPDALSVYLRFAPDGTVTGDRISLSDGSDSVVTIANDTATVHYNDSLEPCWPGSCSMTGTWTSVDPPNAGSAPIPEPASPALLSVGLLGIAAVRRWAT